MLCEHPITLKVGMVGCGQCQPCRINRRRVWVHRLLLEQSLHTDSAFVTLTYDDANLPKIKNTAGDLVGNLEPPHLRDFLKRLRNRLPPGSVRFFGVGEYGDQDERPHYHLALFGFPSCQYIQSRYSRVRNCCPSCDLIRDTWGKGHVFLGTLEENSVQYIAGYVLKKMTGKDDKRLLGRHPEFSRMSNRPGIGAHMMDEMASTLMTFNLETTQADLPVSLRHGTRKLPLGRYLGNRLAQLTGKSDEKSKKGKEYLEEEMSRLRQVQMDHPSGKVSLTQVYLEENKQKLRNFHAKRKLKK